MRAWGMAVLLALAGCGSDEGAENAANVAAPAPAGPRLGEVDLTRPVRATDAALTWALEIAPGSISLTRFAGRGAEGGVTDFYPVGPVVGQGTAVWTTKDPSGARVSITLTDARCRAEGDPDIDRPLTAELRIGDELLRGCAGPRAADGLDGAPNGNGS